MITRRNKIQLWEELKIESITRIISLIYATALLVFFTRVQFNIIGRQQYAEYLLEGLDHLGGNNNGQKRTNEFSSTESIEHQIINEQYLLFNWWLVNRGWGGIVKGVRSSVQQVFHDINPRQELSFQNVYDLIKRVQSLVDYPSLPGHQNKKRYASFLLPPKELETFIIAQGMGVADIYEPNFVNTKNLQGGSDSVPDIYPELQIHDYLRCLLDETTKLTESLSAIKVIDSLISSGLDVFLAQVADGSYKFNDTDSLLNNTGNTRDDQTLDIDIQVDTEKKVMDGSPDLNTLCAMLYSNINID
ncbi:hypothetical protein NADFUDRAFT_68462 [Nadsonia fulvescens var. elongata DSM 6958]|uniref:Peroxin-3 n=1 Tax=Nadsonia fulvescens var. elongata DSM 6958 TaxID=857566 RepID=A0A1E3PRW5_9ASCO|nr:hypothetical protein NADFUDRAFT_68462 [Nadsonia fulvescens var. elongata DSM 6958]